MTNALGTLVREQDRDRYLSALLFPTPLRQDVLALYAFNVEISRIPRLVTEPQLGEIRLQWWADTLAALAGGEAVDHPVAQALAASLKRHQLPVEPLVNLVEAHRLDLYANSFPDFQALELYVAQTETPLMQLAAMMLNRQQTAQAANLIGAASTAFGLARLFASEHAQKKIMPPGESAGTLHALAKHRLAQARAEVMPEGLWAALAPAALTNTYLAGKTGPLRRQWVLWRATTRMAL